MGERLNVCPGREVSDHPSHALCASGRSRLAAESDGVLFPFIVRSLSKKALGRSGGSGVRPHEPARLRWCFCVGRCKRDRGFLG